MTNHGSSEFFKVLSEIDPAGISGGASDEEISATERLLGVQVYGSYRVFLATVGSYFSPGEIYGIEPGTIPVDNSVARLTISERRDVEPPMRHSLVPFYADGFGNHFCIDTGHVDDGEPPVVFWNHERSETQECPPVFRSFEDWFNLYFVPDITSE